MVQGWCERRRSEGSQQPGPNPRGTQAGALFSRSLQGLLLCRLCLPLESTTWGAKLFTNSFYQSIQQFKDRLYFGSPGPKLLSERDFPYHILSSSPPAYHGLGTDLLPKSFPEECLSGTRALLNTFLSVHLNLNSLVGPDGS